MLNAQHGVTCGQAFYIRSQTATTYLLLPLGLPKISSF
jgi:hypothetical protein